MPEVEPETEEMEEAVPLLEAIGKLFYNKHGRYLSFPGFVWSIIFPIMISVKASIILVIINTVATIPFPDGSKDEQLRGARKDGSLPCTGRLCSGDGYCTDGYSCYQCSGRDADIGPTKANPKIVGIIPIAPRIATRLSSP
mgnify:CR=1 FL=1